MDKEKSFEIWLTEFKALRNEIEYRTKAQYTLLTINIIGLSSIFSIAHSRYLYSFDLLMIIPWFSSIIGLLFLEHDFSIARIGCYITNIIAPKLKEICGDNDVLSWEIWVRNIPGKFKAPRRLAFYLSVPTIFLFPSFIVLLLFTKPYHNSQHILFLSLSWGIYIITLGLWIYRHFYWKNICSYLKK